MKGSLESNLSVAAFFYYLYNMKLIPLTQGKFAQVDDEDYDVLMKRKWQAHKSKRSNVWYAISNIKLDVNKWKSIKMHRVIMKIDDPKILIDHKDDDGLNNQKNNLRLADKSKNSINRSKKNGFSSKYLGVRWYAPRNKWSAQIQLNNKAHHLGYFINEKEAAQAYNNAALSLHKEFARLNIIEDNVCI